ncbi:sodium:alanine symporter [Anaerocolumna cellulosilytica]|uniref:Sodium:alanine symporter n=1 Tax=Anaerocolumna cellulosilytica TaxID=433286 RepID=A0A6S6R389_9FIRM|nr:sodium:alanine symporter family protein [Anaerocolumna cellulosilytica]MBB5196797.1 AGCS family alanine or glycine:cation symporter [Anaerocolumna cellulosilytica]BCJ95809.1 sodium:alanine symporter [Anaerocolumna cellulosilytica]
MLDWIVWLNTNIIWGIPMLILMLGTGVFLVIRIKGVIFTRFGTVMANTLKTIFKKQVNDVEGTITPFQAVCTALAATVGTGNIVGIAIAISIGGPGAIFWMWICAVLGMVTKFCETTLAVAYREKNAKGDFVGGPMYYISKGLGWKKTSVAFCVFAVFASFGVGNMVQANAVSSGLKLSFHLSTYVTGIILAALVGLVIIGGIKRIAAVAETLVPFMAAMYIIAAVIVLIINAGKIPAAIQMIFADAFKGSAAVGGFAGSTMLYAARIGIARGVFTNEAGLGSAPIAHASANTDHPARQGCWGAFEVFFDTIIMCTVTALVIITSGLWSDSSMDGTHISLSAFRNTIPGGEYVVSIGIVLFAFATIIAWYYYAEKALEYIAGVKVIRLYQIVFVLLVFVGCIAEVDVVWELADLFNGLMAIPNLIALFALSTTIVKLTSDFFKDAKRIRPKDTSFSTFLQTKK